jgi:hypothetical protein
MQLGNNRDAYRLVGEVISYAFTHLPNTRSLVIKAIERVEAILTKLNTTWVIVISDDFSEGEAAFTQISC